MAKAAIDGNDVLAVRAAVADAAELARAGGGPRLIEALTYRQKGHSRSDPATYRPAGELDAWLERDPIARTEASLRAAGVSDAQLADVRARARSAVTEALERAKAMPDPEPAERLEDVYAGGFVEGWSAA